MGHVSKRARAIKEKADRSKFYPLADAFRIIKETATAKFDESVDVAVNLGIDAKKSDQAVRGSVVLPSGTGKTARVAVFAHRRLEGSSSGGMTASSAYAEVSVELTCAHPGNDDERRSRSFQTARNTQRRRGEGRVFDLGV